MLNTHEIKRPLKIVLLIRHSTGNRNSIGGNIIAGV